MNISRITIHGYRRFMDETISFCGDKQSPQYHEDDNATTIFVGSNNSGKTSIVELMQNMLGTGDQYARTSAFTFDDFNIDARNEWSRLSRDLILNYLMNPDQFFQDPPSPDAAEVMDTPDSATIPAAFDVPPTTDDPTSQDYEGRLAELLRGIIAPVSFEDSLAALPVIKEIKSNAPTISVQISVDYTDNDDIRDVVNFLLDFRDVPSGIYFKYTVQPDVSRLSPEQRDTAFIGGARRIINTYRKETAQKTNSPATDDDTTTPQTDETIQAIDNTVGRVVDEVLMQCFSSSLTETAFYCNPTFDDCRRIQTINQFRRVFDCRVITARRDLDDIGGDHTHKLSSRLLNTVAEDDAWIETVSNIQSSIQDVLDDVDYKRLISSESRNVLNPVISEISESNGGHADPIALNGRITSESIKKFLNDNTVAEFGDDLISLSERSQGLGYSNLILILIDFLAFLQQCSMNPRSIHIIIIEEPESHMHPQMQSVFIRQVFKKMHQLAQSTAPDRYVPTCMVTTHSTQIVQEATISQIRVLRPCTDHKRTAIIDLMKELQKSDAGTSLAPTSGKEEQRRAYEILFGLNFADIVFADKAILFEGDTERMYLKALIRGADNSSKNQYLETLRKQYISYVQVGGRHAFEYVKLLAILGIRSMILTDIDYPKTLKRPEPSDSQADGRADEPQHDDSRDLSNNKSGNPNKATKAKETKEKLIEPDSTHDWKAVVNAFPVTNPTLKRAFQPHPSCGETATDATTLTVQDIYHRFHQESTARTPPVFGLGRDSQIAVYCQTDQDGYARTLEEAMLCKAFEIPDVFQPNTRAKWASQQQSLTTAGGHEHAFPIPNGKGDEIRVRDVVNSIANGSKTDFMYAIILSNHCKQALPHYIEEGLRWLAADQASTEGSAS